MAHPKPHVALAFRDDLSEKSQLVPHMDVKPAAERWTVREIFLHYAPYLYRVMRRLGVPESDVDDLCQDVFIVVQRQLPSFEGRSSIRTWLYGIGIRVASDYRKRASVMREQVMEHPPEVVVPESSTDDLDRARAREMLHYALDLLPAEQREAFVLHEIEGLSLKEVSEALGAPLQTVYSRLQVARKRVEGVFAGAFAERSAG